MSRECNEVVLSRQTLAEVLSGGAAFAGRFGHHPLGSDAGPVKEGAEVGCGLKAQLEPAVSNGLQMPHEFEDTQCSPLLQP